MAHSSYVRLSAQGRCFLVAEAEHADARRRAIEMYEAGRFAARTAPSTWPRSGAGVKPTKQPGAGASVIARRTGQPA